MEYASVELREGKPSFCHCFGVPWICSILPCLLISTLEVTVESVDLSNLQRTEYND